MIDERYLELINKELDGLCTEEESKDLEEYLSGNAEALQYYDELLRMAIALKRVEQVEPPSFLKTHIFNTVKALPLPGPNGMGVITTIRDMFRQRPAARYGLVFASGLAAGVVLFVVTQQSKQDEMPDVSRMGGSMVVPSEIAHLRLIDSVAVEGAGFRGVFKTLRGDGTITVDCAVASTDNVRLELTADLDELRFIGVNRLGGTDNDVMATAGRVVFTGTRAEHGLITYSQLSSPQVPIEVRIFKAGAVVGSASVRTN